MRPRGADEPRRSVGLGPTQTRMRSAAGQVVSMPCSRAVRAARRRRRARRCAAAPARAARSGCPAGRSARPPARPARGRRPCPRAGARSSSSGGRSTSSISSARSRIASGTVSRTRDAGDLRDDVVEALDVLDVERGVDVDARRRAARSTSCQRLAWREPGRVGVGQLVDEQQAAAGAPARASRSNSASVVPRYSTARRGRTSRPSSERRGLGAAVRLDARRPRRRRPARAQPARASSIA